MDTENNRSHKRKISETINALLPAKRKESHNPRERHQHGEAFRNGKNSSIKFVTKQVVPTISNKIISLYRKIMENFKDCEKDESKSPLVHCVREHLKKKFDCYQSEEALTAECREQVLR